jgi:transcriptional regulator with XRE-family HTH domain
MDIRKILGRNLKDLRGDLTQEEVAEACGFEIPSYSRWENGKAWASSDTVERLAKYFKVNPSELYKNNDSPRIKPFAETLPVKRLIGLLEKKLNSVPDDIFDLAQGIDHDDIAWEDIRAVLEHAAERKIPVQKAKKA